MDTQLVMDDLPRAVWASFYDGGSPTLQKRISLTVWNMELNVPHCCIVSDGHRAETPPVSKEIQLYVSLWVNDPSSHLIYNLSKWFHALSHQFLIFFNTVWCSFCKFGPIWSKIDNKASTSGYLAVCSDSNQSGYYIYIIGHLVDAFVQSDLR